MGLISGLVSPNDAEDILASFVNNGVRDVGSHKNKFKEEHHTSTIDNIDQTFDNHLQQFASQQQQINNQQSPQ